MNIVLFGQKWLAAEILTALAALPDVRVIAVCPDGFASQGSAGDGLATLAHSLGIPVLHKLDDVPPCDMAVAAHCHRFSPAVVRARCGLGVLAYHPSLLPRHRGRDAIRWTLAMRESITGGTLYWMDDGADTGPIEMQDWCHVLPDDTPTALWQRDLAPMGVRLLTECVTRLASGAPPNRMPQNERAATWEPSFHRKRLE